MIAGFDVWSFKDIQKVCAPALAETEARPLLAYIDLEFTDDWCSAYGSNGFQISKVTVPCKLSTKGLLEPVKVLIKPVKVPAKTKRVLLRTGDPETLYFAFYGESNTLIDETSQPVIKGDPVPFDSIFKTARDKLDDNRFIVMNPSYLMAALEGMKNCESVIINYGSQTDAITVRPYMGKNCEIQAEALVFPVRP